MNWLRKIFTIEEPVFDLSSTIYTEKTFYKQFIRDLVKAKKEIIIECPYITIKRLSMLMPTLKRLKARGVQMVIITREPQDNDEFMAKQAEIGIQYFENFGVQVLLVLGGHHRKLAMIDNKILWEGNLNILSQSNSHEFMRRIESEVLTRELIEFL
jgi:phosphatidylserine/phosphatidylglycerophosphate/cardiolipin synthase-like enzyme